METATREDNELLIGVHVRYSGTGSAGEVLALRSDDDGIWAKVDTTQLWYNSRYLELLDEKEYKKIKDRESKKKSNKFNEDADEKEVIKKKIDSVKQKLDGVDMSSELCDGGG
ncbi:DUF2098 domain-containing protein [Methanobacterium petrolearium]|uniref:DUF2098 domain-containing protein n=1 Tax=Methanobacterium petrolearium TaxID=710190 RepID=UPI001AE26705|nr:hypothetical protein [Methanobacterium petrolearium]BDZ71081.1 hypothetical protein GCM10025861_15980 [Methanobacterium petrolearium]